MNHELAGTVDDYLLLWFKRLSRGFYALGMVRSALLSQDVAPPRLNVCRSSGIVADATCASELQ
jgi:hypothetical protein